MGPVWTMEGPLIYKPIFHIYIYIWTYIYGYIYMDMYIWIPGTRYQIVPGTRSCRVPDLPGRARYQIVPGTRSCQVPDRARYLIVPGTCLSRVMHKYLNELTTCCMCRSDCALDDWVCALRVLSCVCLGLLFPQEIFMRKAVQHATHQFFPGYILAEVCRP
jgi:hypothetical protein